MSRGGGEEDCGFVIYGFSLEEGIIIIKILYNYLFFLHLNFIYFKLYIFFVTQYI